MVKRIRISRQGLTECPSCNRHIRVEDDLTSTSCPFCDQSLIQALHNGQSVQLSRSSMMTASLLSLGLAVASCDNGRQMVQPIYGAPSPPVDSGSAATDTSIRDEDSGQAVDSEFIDAGLHPDAGESPAQDAAVTVDAEADAGGPVPLYGLPPSKDAATSDADVSKDATVDSGSAVTPVYGLPPPTDGG